MPLVNTKGMFKVAYEQGFAVGAFNVNNMELIQGIMEAIAEEKAPVILQLSKGARQYANPKWLTALIQTAAAQYPDIPICMHLDHGDTVELANQCVDEGYGSVMIDKSHDSVRGQRGRDQEGRRPRPRPQVLLLGRGRTRPPGRHRRARRRRVGRRPRQVPDRPEGSPGVRQGHRRRQPGRRHRHQPRRLQVQERAEAGLRPPREDPRAAARIPAGPARRQHGHRVLRREDQQVRRPDGQGDGRARGGDPQGQHAWASARSTSIPTCAWR